MKKMKVEVKTQHRGSKPKKDSNAPQGRVEITRTVYCNVKWTKPLPNDLEQVSNRLLNSLVKQLPKVNLWPLDELCLQVFDVPNGQPMADGVIKAESKIRYYELAVPAQVIRDLEGEELSRFLLEGLRRAEKWAEASRKFEATNVLLSFENPSGNQRDLLAMISQRNR